MNIICWRNLNRRRELVNITSQTSTGQRSDTSCFTLRLAGVRQAVQNVFG